MRVRHFLPGVIWVAAMFLVFLTPRNDFGTLFFNTIPSASFLYIFLFWGFMQFWLAACKKQVTKVPIRRNAFGIATISAVTLIILGEMLVPVFLQDFHISWWNILFSIIGIGLGLLTFKLLYRSCY